MQDIHMPMTLQGQEVRGSIVNGNELLSF